MKKIIVFMILATVVTASADVSYIFRVSVTKGLLASYTTEKDVPKYINDAMFNAHVTEQQFKAGWDALPQSVKDAKKDEAFDEGANYDNWQDDLQSIVETMRAELNTLRTNAGMSEITKQEMKSKIKNKKPKKN